MQALSRKKAQAFAQASILGVSLLLEIVVTIVSLLSSSKPFYAARAPRPRLMPEAYIYPAPEHLNPIRDIVVAGAHHPSSQVS